MVFQFIRSFLIAFVLAAPAHAAERFISVIDDLPLMAGLEETGDSVSFTTPQGRIAEAVAQGAALGADAVRAFYAQTLPQLGWRAGEQDQFVREGESLKLSFNNEGGRLRVRFVLAPAAK